MLSDSEDYDARDWLVKTQKDWDKRSESFFANCVKKNLQ
jgi:hypothetical protein